MEISTQTELESSSSIIYESAGKYPIDNEEHSVDHCMNMDNTLSLHESAEGM